MSTEDYYKAKDTGVADMSKQGAGLGLVARENREHAEGRARRQGGRTTIGAASTPLHVGVFGIIGAFLFGVIQPFGMGWFVSAVLGFIGAGVAAGLLAKYTIGKIILAIVGVGFAALVGFAIFFAG
ncbi:MAG: hypothetical protein PVI23_16420 [Maricaulaceae bacterium]|jgi:hypothetical protein